MSDDAYFAHLLPLNDGYHQLAGLHLLEPSLGMSKEGTLPEGAEQDGFQDGLPIIRECADRCHAVVDGKIIYNCMNIACDDHYRGVVSSDVCKDCPVRRGREAQ